ncbi:MAG: hypothetical protein WC740_24010, partial [Verrucomicrobiia bacterium]
CQGHFTGPDAAYADASRTGADIVHVNQPPKWPNLLSQARCTLNQVFAHNIVFYADPDTLLVGDFLEIEQARLATTVVALPGQMMFSGDKLAGLKSERMRLLQQSLPVCNVRPLNLYPIFDMRPVWDLKVRRSFEDWDVVALFNWTENDAVVGFDFTELGLASNAEYLLHEFWTNSFQGVRKGHFEMPVPKHGVRLLAIHRAKAHPQFVSSDRHITQGAVELKNIEWQETGKCLKGTVKVVKNSPMTMRFRVPSAYSFDAAKVADAATCTAATETKDIVAVTLKSSETKDIAFTLTFK